MNKTRGRPRGNPATKAHIVEAARGLFLERGYRGTTVRAVAAAAGVDSALISYHFGNKQGLFGESVQLPCGESLALSTALAGERAGLPERLLVTVTDSWDQSERLQVPHRMALQDENVMDVFREYLERELLGGIAEFLGGPDATERATAAVGVIAGLIFTRYLNPLGPSAGLTAAEVHRVFGPPLRAALFGRTRHTPAARHQRPEGESTAHRKAKAPGHGE